MFDKLNQFQYACEVYKIFPETRHQIVVYSVCIQGS